ncbi:hypothetical protein L1D24_17470 [Vibrio brasiliensis]|uniref:hypothetical protein n=1 Tax=Vibrio brasiliensis TaxID=170652 RepID=UPI001EFE2FE2|nr:hypothetical protein [Vibrio brasiliensis]MCG9650343.1 hypothetical protein [Vibrio brasiliensis]
MSKANNASVESKDISVFSKSETAFLMEPCEALIHVAEKPYYVDKWDFSSTHSVAIHNRLSICFTSVPKEYRRDIQETLYTLFHSDKVKNGSLPTIEAVKRWKVALQRISILMGGTAWDSIDDRATFGRLKRQIRKSSYSDSSVQAIITVLNKLREAGVIRRFVNGPKLRALVSDRTVEQAIAVPIRIYQELVSEALKVVEMYFDHRHTISRVMKEAYDIHAALKPHTPSSTISRKVREIEHGIPSIEGELNGYEVNRIQVACVIVILAFSGVRLGEVFSFNKNSYTDKNINGNTVAILEGSTSKGENGEPKKRVWQSHPIVEKALLLADDMIESTRRQYEVDIDNKELSGRYTVGAIQHMRRQLSSAFLTTHALKQRADNYITTAMDRRILAFLKRSGIKATKKDVEEFALLNPTRSNQLKLNGFIPKLSPHDFRRTFAVFFVRYGFGTPSGIKFQYGHNNLNMSNYYANNAAIASMNDMLLDKDLLKELEEAKIELGVEMFDDIFNQTKHLSGSQGESIHQQKLEKLNQGCHVYMSRTEIEAHVRSGDFSIIQLPTGGYCTNSSCDRFCGIHTFSSKEKPCSHEVCTDKEAQRIARYRERMIDTFNDLNKGDRLKRSMLSALKQRIQVKEKTLDYHQIEYVPFNEKILA